MCSDQSYQSRTKVLADIAQRRTKVLADIAQQKKIANLIAYRAAIGFDPRLDVMIKDALKI